MSVLSYLEELARQLPPTGDELNSIKRSISHLKTRLDTHFDDGRVREHFQFGSSTRGTMLTRAADPESDVDYMVVFDKRSQVKPQGLLDRLRSFATKHYGASEIYQSNPTLVLSLNHIRFELVPAYPAFLSAYKIPGRASGFSEWIGTDPKEHEKAMADASANDDGRTRATIRLLKYWNALNGYIFPSFELETRIVGRGFWRRWDLKRRVFAIVDGLPRLGVSAADRDKVERAKKIVGRVTQLEEADFSEYAALEVQRLFPPLR